MPGRRSGEILDVSGRLSENIIGEISEERQQQKFMKESLKEYLEKFLEESLKELPKISLEESQDKFLEEF